MTPIVSTAAELFAQELRGTLTPLQFGIRIIRAALASRPDMLRVLDMIDRQTTEIGRLSEDPMDATRVGQGTFRVDQLNVESLRFWRDSCVVAASAAAARWQTFTIQIPDRTLRIEGDPVRLAHAVTNLLHNAVKSTPVNGDIKLFVQSKAKDLIISVRDNELGISDALLPDVFELFAQSSRTIKASAGGLGVGLAVVKAVAESHGGTVPATSAGPGAGSEFTLGLPIVTQHCTVCNYT